MSDPKKEDVLDLLREERVKLEAERDAAREELAAMKKAAAAAPPPPAPAPAPVPAPAPPPLQVPKSPLDFVGRPIAEQEALKKTYGADLFDRLMEKSYGGRVHITEPGIYTPGEFVLRPDSPAPASSGRKPAPSSAKRS